MFKRVLSALLTLILCMGLCSPVAMATGEGASPLTDDTLTEPGAEAYADGGVILTISHPGEGEDASPNIQKAIALAKSLDRPVTLAFEAGKTYEVWPETAYHNMNYYISNAATKAENANGERWSAIFLKDMQNVTIEGNNALLLTHGVMTPILIDRCENITLQNLHVDWARPTMSEFTIKEVGDNYTRIEINESSLYEISGNKVRWLSEEKPGGGYYWTLTDGIKNVYDPIADTARGSNFAWGTAIEDEGGNVLKLTYTSRPNLTVGQTHQFRSGSRDQVGSFVHKSKDVRFENMGFHYMHGLGIVGQYTENISFNNLDCTPRPETGRTCASSADFIQISGCKGLVSITNSKFKGSHDDVFNIHGTHLQIVNKEEAQNKITVRFMQERSWGFQAFDVGDEIEFVTPNNMLPYAKNTVERFNRLDDYEIELFLRDPLPAGIALNSDVVENITNTPDVIVKNNYASAVTTRGILCTTRGEVLIEGNTFYKMGMSGVLLEDDTRQWYESGPIKNMTIKDNIFDNCGGPVIFSNPQTSVYDPNQTVHSNITITGNTFKGNSQINMKSTGNVVIEKNIFEDGGNVALTACNGFEIKDDNVGLGTVSASNSLNDMSLASIKLDTTTQVETLPRADMTATASNERSDFPVNNVLDGNNESFWHSDWENVPEELSITVDLNGEKSFNRVACLPRQSNDAGKIKSYELYTKNGDGDFAKIAEGNWSVNTEEKYITLAQAVTATQVKLVATEVTLDTSNRRIASIAEINFQNVQETADSVSTGTKFKIGFSAKGATGMPSLLPEGAASYQSSDEAVATVAADGTIAALTEGSANITVTVTAYGKTLSSTATIAVTGGTYVAADSIAIDPISEAVGSALQLAATVTPAGAKGDLRWSAETLSGGTASIDQTGLLTASAAARVLVTAYSQNDPSVKDTLMLVVKPDGETADTWSIVRENKANWRLGAGNSLELATEPGAIWAGTDNVKNVITMAAGKDNFSLVTKMDYKPGADYAEAGIILYVDDSNYTLLSRKQHSGYGGNIFSMITEAGGTPHESPAAVRVMDTIDSREVYLKLTKTDDIYSGYFSADGTTWSPVWENQTLTLGAAPRVGVIGYGSGVAKYAYLEIDGEKVTFEELVPPMTFSEAEVTAVTQAQYKTVKGTAWEGLSLPERVSLTWNGDYRDTDAVVWEQGNYDKDTIGSYEVGGTLKTVTSAMLGEHTVTAVITVTADKSVLREAVRVAETKVEAGYTAESWAVFAAALEAASDMLASTDDAVTQEAVDAQVITLKTAQSGLVRKADRETLMTLTEAAGALLTNTADKLYLDEQARTDWRNGYFSTTAYAALNASKTAAEELLAKEELPTDAEIAQATETLVDTMETLSESEHMVDCTALQETVDRTKTDFAALRENDYTAESWAAVSTALAGADELIATGTYTTNEVTAAKKTITDAWSGLRRYSSGSGGSSNTTTKTEKNPDGSTTKTVTDKKTGAVTATTTYPDGTKIVAVTSKDGETSIEVTVPKDKDSVIVTIPTNEQPKAGEVAVIVHEDGTREVVKTSVATEDGMRVTLTGNAKLELVDNSKSFGDVASDHWGAGAILFTTSRELFNGTGAESFSPAANMSRAMLVTVLARLDGQDTAKGETWDAVGVAWANENGVSDGSGLEQAITREQLAVMLYRYAKAEKLDADMTDFSDGSGISSWAVEAVGWAVKSGIITGKGGELDPQGKATRAEVAAMLQRFVENTI